MKKYYLPLGLIGLLIVLTGASWLGLFSDYLQTVAMYIGVNIILTASLNLVNGYMGEFSVGHAGFMAVGAYVSTMFTTRVIPHFVLGTPLIPSGLYPLEVAAWAENPAAYLVFPLTLLMGGLGAALVGLLVAVPSFKIRGDYLAIITLAVNYIVKSACENTQALGGSRGITGIPKLSNVPLVFLCAGVSLWAMRNFILSSYGRGVVAVREDEIAAELMTVNTRHSKIMAFCISSFFAGIGGGLLAHLLLYINPSTFSILKSVECLAMVYLGGMSSISGSILGAIAYTGLSEALRPLRLWKWVVIPLILIFLMLFRREGIMGGREFKFLLPKEEVKGYAAASD
jgi:branched-chain amino acid transport system permease protein